MGLLWTDEQLEKLKVSYTNTDISLEELAQTMGRSVDSLKQKARSLSLSRRTNYWHKDEVEYLKGHYPNPNIPVEDICHRLNRTLPAVVNKAKKLKIIRRSLWSDAEIEQLKSLVGENPLRVVKKRYNIWAGHNGYSLRSDRAIYDKIKNMKLHLRLEDNDEWLTANDIALLFGVDRSTASRWFTTYKDVFKPVPTGNQDPNKPGIKYAVHRRNVRSFCLENPSLVERHKHNLEMVWLLDILAG